LFAGMDWRRVTALETHPPAAAEWLGVRFGQAHKPIF
jgi:hypothetical protein